MRLTCRKGDHAFVLLCCNELKRAVWKWASRGCTVCRGTGSVQGASLCQSVHPAGTLLGTEAKGFDTAWPSTRGLTVLDWPDGLNRLTRLEIYETEAKETLVSDVS